LQRAVAIGEHLDLGLAAGEPLRADFHRHMVLAEGVELDRLHQPRVPVGGRGTRHAIGQRDRFIHEPPGPPVEQAGARQAGGRIGGVAGHPAGHHEQGVLDRQAFG